MNKKNEMLDLFIEGLQSKHSKENYMRVILEFEAFIEKDTKEAKVEDVDRYYNFLKTKNISNTIATKLRAIKSYCEYLSDRDIIVKNPITPVLRKVKCTEAVRDVLTREEIAKLIDGTNDITTRTILVLFSNTGLRVAELCNIKYKDINFEEFYIEIVGKGNKPARVPLNAKAIEALKFYLKYSKSDINSEDLLFLTRNKKPYTRQTIEGNLRILAKKVGVNKKVSCHTFRRSYATILYNETKDPKLVQEALRHSDVTTTLNNYIKPCKEETMQRLSNFSI